MQAGYEVIGCDLSLFPDAICQELVKPTVQLLKDFRDLTIEDLNNVDAIAHLAAISNDSMGRLDPGLTHSINGKGSVDLGRKAKLAGVKVFTFASSCSLYGSAGENVRTEEDLVNPISEYAISKLFAEEGLAHLADEDFHVYLLRSATAYGVSPVMRMDLVVNDLSAGMYAYGVAEIRSDGTPWRPLINCKDMARAFQLFIENDPTGVNGKPVNIGFQKENFRVRDVGVLVLKNWPEGIVTYVPNAYIDSGNYKVSFQLLESIFPSFSPEHPLEKGIPELRKLLENINYSKIDRENKKYIRLKEFQKRLEKLK